MRKISADWIFPVSSPPIKNGAVVIDHEGKILEVSERKNFDEAQLEIHNGIICPGFINAHCHLELSYLKEKISEHTGLVGFISEVLRKRNDSDSSVKLAVEDADKEMWRNGIVGVGDISNASISFQLKVKSPIRYHTFVECFGLVPEKAEEYFRDSLRPFHEARKLNLDASITPHAPYSMSDELFEKLFAFNENDPDIFSYHNQESEEENKLYRGEANSFDQFYSEFHLPTTHDRRAESSLKAHLEFFPRNKKILFVHNTYTSETDFQFVTDYFNYERETGKTNPFFCTCPNANLFIENKLPDYSFWKNYPDQICIGTDSYASNHQLSILEEIKTIQKHSEIPLPQLIQWSTLNGANFFGWEDLGSLEKGKKPGLNLITAVDKETLQLSTLSAVAWFEYGHNF